MKRFTLLALIIAPLSILYLSIPQTTQKPTATIKSNSENKTISKQQAQLLLSQLPLHFIENKGQWNPELQFMARKDALSAYFKKDGILIQLSKSHDKQQTIGIQFENTSHDVSLIGQEEQQAKFSYYLGNDRSQWQENVPSFTSIVYKKLYSGIDLKIKELNGRLEYDILLEPKADLSKLIIKTDGVEKISLAKDGSLVMHTALGEITQTMPATWYELPNGQKQKINAQFKILDGNRYSFEVPNRNTDLALVIDPAFQWSTFVGGNNYDNIYAVAIAQYGSGDIFVAGQTYSTDFPAAVLSLGSPTELYVSRVKNSATSATIVSTILFGGAGIDYVRAMAIDPFDNTIAITGSTSSSNFPTTPGSFATTISFGPDAFISLFTMNDTTNSLKYSSYFGGSHEDNPLDIAFYKASSDPSSKVIIGGYTDSVNIPITQGSYISTPPSTPWTHSGFIAEILPASQGALDLVYSSYLNQEVNGLAVFPGASDPNPDIIIVGKPKSNFTTTPGSFQPTPTMINGFIASLGAVTRLHLAGSGFNDLLYATYFNGDIRDVDIVPSTQDVVFTGASLLPESFQPETPTTTGSYDTTHNGGYSDAFISRLSVVEGSGPSGLKYSSFLGSYCREEGISIKADKLGITIVGSITTTVVGGICPNLPTTADAYVPTANYGAFLTRFNETGSALLYSTYIKANPVLVDFDQVDASPYELIVAVGALANTISSSVATTGDQTLDGSTDGFLLRFSFPGAGLPHFGSNGCVTGATAPECNQWKILVNKTPHAGDNTFKVILKDGPPNSFGVLLIGTEKTLGSVPLLDCAHTDIDLTKPYISKNFFADANGYAEVNVPLPAGSAGITGYTQFLISLPAACNSPNYSNTDGLEITPQP